MKKYIFLSVAALYSCVVQCAGLSSHALLRSAAVGLPAPHVQTMLTGGARSMASEPMKWSEVMQQNIASVTSPEDLCDLAKKKLYVLESYIGAKPALGFTMFKKSAMFGVKSVGGLVACGLLSGATLTLLHQDAHFFIQMPLLALMFTVPVFKIGTIVGAYKCMNGTIRADEPDAKHLRAEEFYKRIIENPEEMSKWMALYGVEDDYRGNSCLAITGDLPLVVREHLRERSMKPGSRFVDGQE